MLRVQDKRPDGSSNARLQATHSVVGLSHASCMIEIRAGLAGTFDGPLSFASNTKCR